MKQVGIYTQRELVPILKDLIDDASAKGASTHRDIAKAELRRVLKDSNWNTTFILNNLGARRCKYLASLGQPVPFRWLNRDWKWQKDE